jgi:hypothetical protein
MDLFGIRESRRSYSLMMKPQDVLILLKLAANPGKSWSYLQLGKTVGLSSAEAHASVARSLGAGLLWPNKSVELARSSLLEFLIHGLRYVLPPEYVRITRGMPTASSEASLSRSLVPPNIPMVWPLPEGTVRGQGLIPIHAKAPFAAAQDYQLYRLLALVDLLRTGAARERSVATKIITEEIDA